MKEFEVKEVGGKEELEAGVGAPVELLVLVQ